MAAKKISVGGRRFLLEWTSANAVALGAGWAVTGAMQRSRMQPYYETVTSAARAVRLEAPSLGIALAVLGTLVGTAQWWCLRRRLHVSAWWVPATGLGWALFGVVMGVLSGIFGSSVSGIGAFRPARGGCPRGTPGSSRRCATSRDVPGTHSAAPVSRHVVASGESGRSRSWPNGGFRGGAMGPCRRRALVPAGGLPVGAAVAPRRDDGGLGVCGDDLAHPRTDPHAQPSDADRPVVGDGPAGVVGDLPDISVRIGEGPRRAAPLR